MWIQQCTETLILYLFCRGKNKKANKLQKFSILRKIQNRINRKNGKKSVLLYGIWTLKFGGIGFSFQIQILNLEVVLFPSKFKNLNLDSFEFLKYYYNLTICFVEKCLFWIFLTNVITTLVARSAQKGKDTRLIWVFIVLGIYNFAYCLLSYTILPKFLQDFTLHGRSSSWRKLHTTSCLYMGAVKYLLSCDASSYAARIEQWSKDPHKNIRSVKSRVSTCLK